jgi:flagellar biosynthetic protein FliR
VEHYALPVEVYGASLVFARVGALVMLMPGVGETVVPVRARLAFAFLLALVLYPIVRAGLPKVPATVDGLFAQLIVELLIGLALGAILRLFLGVMVTTGEVVSLQTTLAFAQTTNPTQAQPAATVGSFLTVLALTLIFATDLHQLFIGAVAKSYTLFTPGKPPPIGDFASLAIRMTGQTFALGVQLAAPVLVFSLIFNIASGLIGRVMPQFQIFFIATPLTLLFGLSVFALSLGVMGLVWIDRFRAFTIRLT